MSAMLGGKNMSKWEDKYEKLRNGDFDDRIAELAEKRENKSATREEYKEYEKLSKAKQNLGKIDNVLEYREKLKKELEETKKEIKTRKEFGLINQESQKLEEELNKITNEIIETEKELKNPELNEDKKKELLKKREELYGKRDANNSKYAKNQNLLEDNINRKGELKDLSKEEIEDKGLLLKTRISKCNMVAKNLLNGASWDTIDLKLDNWDKKYTRNKDDKNIIKAKPENENITARAEEKKEVNEELGETEEMDVFSDSNAEAYKRNKQLMFEKKHPRLARIQNWFKKVFKKEDKLLTDGSEEQEIVQSEKIKAARKLNRSKENKEKVENVEKTVEDKSFKEYIKVVAEKGVEGASKEEATIREEQAKKKLEEMRKANREAEANKFGKDYADKSDYRNKDNSKER